MAKIKEHVKIFQIPNDGDRVVIKDLPWVGAVKSTVQVLHRKNSMGMLYNENDVLRFENPTMFAFNTVYDNEEVTVTIIVGEDITTITREFLINAISAFNNRFSQETDSYEFDYPENFQGTISLSQIDAITFNDNITRIEDDAFANCSSITSIGLGKNIEYIGKRAFLYCSSLVTLELSEKLSYIDDYAFNNCNKLKSTLIFQYGLKHVGNHAFDGCTQLQNVYLPEGTEYIGDHAFNECTNLRSINIPSGIFKIYDYTFYNCQSLTSIDIPNTVEQIYQYAFYHTGLISINIPNGVTSLGTLSFGSCNNLVSIHIPASVKTFGTQNSNGTWSLDCFANCGELAEVVINDNNTLFDSRDNCNAFIYKGPQIGNVLYPNTLVKGFYTSTIPDSVTRIADSAFLSCYRLQSIHIPLSVISIGYRSFYDCRGLKSVTFDTRNSLLTINNQAFTYCNNQEFTSITIPGNTTIANSSVFAYCSYLKNVLFESTGGEIKIGNSAFLNCNIDDTANNGNGLTIPDNVTLIGDGAFANNKLTDVNKIHIRNGLTNIGSKIFNGNNALGVVCNDVSIIHIPLNYSGIFEITNGITTITRYAFAGCNGLTKIIIPNSVTYLGDYAFLNCTSLTEVSFANDMLLTAINLFAFIGCTGLTSINIPASIRTIGRQAFAGAGLTEITIPETVTTVANESFLNCKSLGIVHFNSLLTGSSRTIQTDTFRGCTSLHTVNLPTTINQSNTFCIGTHAFMGCTSLTNNGINLSVINNGTGADPFRGCTNMSLTTVACDTGTKTLLVHVPELPEGTTTVTFPANVTIDRIAAEAFCDCQRLQTLTIPASVISMGDQICDGCLGLQTVNFESGSLLTTSGISGWAFRNCKNLLIFDTTNAVFTTIGRNAFLTCSKLQRFVMPNTVTSMNGNGYNFDGCSSMTEVVLSTVLTNIPQYAFQYCSNLKTITFTNTVTSIGNYAFRLAGLENVTIHAGITSIGSYAFDGCTSLESVTIEANNVMTVFNPYVFRNCTKLESVTVVPDTITHIYEYAFYNCGILKNLHVPDMVLYVNATAFTGGNQASKVRNIVYNGYLSGKPWGAVTCTTTDINYDED